MTSSMAFPTSGILPTEQQQIRAAGFQSAVKALFLIIKAPLIQVSVLKRWSKLIIQLQEHVFPHLNVLQQLLVI